ncbi:DUF3040 domain-containing protein [Streptomyces tsukubensis]|uniref:DUF3040 domain-containing protein n=1 Tax=Streptomyces tsukubensis TaxID=83656 RepID=A0A1V4A751_9ACTN|nr:DUF3040 domain-containing protein [Streptomyces tsukubensis]OON77270.1 hypothetical protein B1H18_18625 [Streptomyces tsukubensis]QFR92343.1 DUF3040 domain-containing protein [Streptomyces tsukubensis]
MNRFENSLEALEEHMRRSDPGLVRALRTGTLPESRHRRHLLAWLLLAGSLAVLVSGLLIGHGLLLATGLVAAGLGAHLFERPEDGDSGPVGPAGGDREADVPPPRRPGARH